MNASKFVRLVAISFILASPIEIVAAVLFQDDFESYALDDEPSNWDYDPESEITDVGRIDEDPLDANNQVFTGYGGYLADNGAEYTNFVAEWDWMFAEDDGRNNSVGFHMQGPDAHYQLSRRAGGSDWNIYMFDGAFNLIVSEVLPTEIDVWYRVQLSVMNDEFVVKVKEKDDPTAFADLDPVLDVFDDTHPSGFFSTSYWGPIDNVIIADTEQDIIAALTGGVSPLLAGDADQDFDFDQLDLVQVQVAAKYLSGNPATWGEGDWDGAPGGSPGSPPAGSGLFDQLDIIAALGAGTYLTGPYAAVGANGVIGDGQTSLTYDPATGEVGVDAPVGTELTSINIDSANGIFTGAAATSLGGSFDNDADENIFKATFGGSFGSLSFGNVARTGLTEQFVLSDLTVVGSLAGGGDLGNVDLIYVPEPLSACYVWLAVVGFCWLRPRK